MIEKLDDTAREKGLLGLDGWVFDEGTQSIGRAFKFKDFSEAFGFISRVALAAQEANHHPDWSNSYNRVTITLSTHDAGGVTAKDLALAKAIDQLLA